MSWRDYQNNLPRRSRKKGDRKGFVVAIGVLVCIFFLGVVVFSRTSQVNAKVPKQVSSAAEKKTDEIGKPFFQDLLKTDHLLRGPEEVRVATEDGDLAIELTFDTALQRYLMKKLSRHKVDWGGVAVVEPTTGSVLALASYSTKDPELSDLALRATFPAASVFKMVSATAAMERGILLPNSTIRFNGDMYGIRSRQVLRHGGRNRLSLGRAFAKSANVVFGKIGANPQMGSEVLLDYASRFGFNDEIPFGLKVAPSLARIDLDSRYQAARAAAGFGKVRLSPLHGALLAGAAVNEGRIMEPYLVSRAVDQKGALKYAVEPKVWKEAMTPVTARKLRHMMAQTITVGTSRKSFRNMKRRKVLRELQIGGKTGSLSGRNPRGRTEWFVGYARNSRNQKIAIGVVLVSEKYWRIKPSDLARDVFLEYFSPRPIMQASAGVTETFGP